MSRTSLQGLLVSPWFLAAAVLFSFFWQLGDLPLYDLDEGAFSEATREMLESGNFVTPHKDGEPRYDKPVMIYWLQAASVKVFGLNEFALRLPSALAATLWVLALHRFTRKRLDTESGYAASLVMVNALMVSVIARAATADAVLNLLLALTLFEIYRYYEAPSRGPLLRVYLWMGLGFLTKGPVAVFFPLVVSLVFFVSQRQFRAWLAAAFHWPGWLLFLGVALPWYLAIYLDTGPDFFQSFFLRHNLGRFEGAMHGHGGFPGYYLVVLPLIVLPFTGWLLSLVPRVRQSLAEPLDRYLWLWFLVVLLFFSFSNTQLPHYVLYGTTPLFVLMAKYREGLKSRWLAFLPPLVLLVLLLFLPELLELARTQARKVHQIALFEEGGQLLGSSYRLQVAIGLGLVLALALWKRWRPWRGLILAGIVQTAVIAGVVAPRVFEVMQAPVKEAALLARELDLPTVVYRTSMPSFSV